MKKIILILIIFLICRINAQTVDRCSSPDTFATYQSGVHYKDLNNNFAPFIGTWKNVTGNKTFKVTLFNIENVDYGEGYFLDEIQGHFEMIENEGQPNEIVLYKSHRIVGTSGVYFPPIIQGASCGGIGFGGWITDNARADYKMISGRLQITISNTTNPPTAHWQVIHAGERVKITGITVNEFTIPTDIILTKQ